MRHAICGRCYSCMQVGFPLPLECSAFIWRASTRMALACPSTSLMNVDPSTVIRAMTHDEHVRCCPSCGGVGSDPLFLSNNGYSIVRCSRCELAFTDLRGAPPPSSLYPQFDQSDAFVHRLMRRCVGVFLRQRESIVR